MHAPLYYERRTFRRASVVLPLLACAAVSLAIAAQTPLTLVSTVWPPFTNTPDSRGSRSTWSKPPWAESASRPGRRLSPPRSSPRRCSRPRSTAARRRGRTPSASGCWFSPGRISRTASCSSAGMAPTSRPGRLPISRASAWRSSKATVRRRDRERRADLRTLGERRRQPGAAPQRRRGLHVDGRPRGRVHLQQPPEGAGTRLQIGSMPLDHARAVPRAAADAAGRGLDRHALQRAAARNDCRRHLSSPAARGLDSSRHQRRWRVRIRAAPDGAGKAEPKRAYALFTAQLLRSRRRQSPASTSAAISTAIGRACRTATRTAVLAAPDPRRSTGTFFKFTW